MNDMLEGFMAYLEENELVEFDTRSEDDAGFIGRTNRLQWYVFLAKRFGLDMNYEYDICFYGPQSRALAGDYLKYAENRAESPDGRMAAARVVMRLPESFRSEEFLGLVRGRGDDWMEIATTLISRSTTIPNRKHLIENIEWTTNGVSTEYIASVLNDLQAAHMIDLE